MTTHHATPTAPFDVPHTEHSTEHVPYATDEQMRACAQQELLTLKEAQYASLTERLDICNQLDAALHACAIDEEAQERAQGAPASMPIMRARSQYQTQVDPRDTQARAAFESAALLASGSPSLFTAPKVQSAGQTRHTSSTSPSISTHSFKSVVEAAVAQTRTEFDASFSQHLDPQEGTGIDLHHKELFSMGAVRLRELTIQGALDPQKTWHTFLHQAARTQQDVGAFEYLFDAPPSSLLATDTSALGPLLAGVPLAVKSLFWVQGQKTTASSAALCKFIAPVDATVVSGVRASGALLIGSTRMDEFGMGGTGAKSAWGPTAHPFRPGYSPGGSSSGSAAAVASGAALLALGSDTGGSVRQPASYCGLWGLKPSWGALPRFGMVPYSFSFDTPGLFATRAEDLALGFEATSLHAGALDRTAVSTRRTGLFARTQRQSPAFEPSSVRLGFIDQVEHIEHLLHPGVLGAFKQWRMDAERAGFTCVDVKLPALQAAISSYYCLVCSEAQSSLARYDPLRFGFSDSAQAFSSYEAAASSFRSHAFGAEVQERLMLGALLLSDSRKPSLYAKALALRTALITQYQAAFKEADFLVSPATCGLPPSLTTPFTASEEWAQDVLSVGASLAGVCAVSAPWARFTHEGVDFPLGIQIAAPWLMEEKLLSACSSFERTGVFTSHDVFTFTQKP